MPADEQDAVGEWLVKNQPVHGVRISKSKQSDHYFGKYIAYAPGSLVAAYADGDTIRTEKLFNLLYPKTVDREMLGAYDRERKLMPILLEMERQGLPVDLPRLRGDVYNYSEWLTKINAWVLKQLKSDESLNLDSGEQLIAAMVAAKKVNIDLMPLTAKGKFQTNKEALLLGVTDKVLLAVLTYRTQLNTCLNTFMKPWLAVAEQSCGLIFTTWNQTKMPYGDHNVGARTGRLSSTPNFQNIPNEFKLVFDHQDPGKKLPKCPFKGLPNLPQIRTYITPFKGEVLIDRDYSQQEPRILAHFDGGQLMDRYNQNPWTDLHDYAKAELEKMGLHYGRKPVKDINLGLIYGMGVGKMAMKTGLPVDETGFLKTAILKLYPGISDMYKNMKKLAKANEPIRTWGDREYYCEPPKMIDGRMRSFDYKLINILVQGSASDCTKEAIIAFNDVKEKSWKLILNVHDQLTASVPKADLKRGMSVLKSCMENIQFKVPMLTEGKISSTNWGELKDYDKKGVTV
jgi:DNA polymerase-1